MGHHDLFFKQVFSIRESAVDFVRHILPPSMQEGIDYTTLTFEKDSHVDEKLSQRFALQISLNEKIESQTLKNQEIVILHSIIKKTRKTPKKERRKCFFSQIDDDFKVCPCLGL
jgi:hypothetical protein